MNIKLYMQIAAIIVIIAVIYLLYKLILSISRIKRIEIYSIDNKEDLSLEKSIYIFINKVSKVLKQLLIFNDIANNYEKYINKNSKLKEGMDILSLKIILSIIFMCIYLFSISITKLDYSVYVFVMFIIIGFIIPDIYYQIIYKKHKDTITDEILRAVIIMNNCFKSNKSIEQALNEVINRLNGPIELEFRKVLYDTRLDLTVSEAMMRMYKRTNIKTIEKMSIRLALTNKSGANLIEIFEQIEKDIIEEEKIRNELINIRKINSLYYMIFMLIPIITIITLMIYNSSYFNLFINKYSYILVILLVLIYSIYLYIIAKMIRRRY